MSTFSSAVFSLVQLFDELCLLSASQPHVWASWCFWKHNRNSGPRFCIMVCLFLLGYYILIDTHHHELWCQLVVCHCYLWWILMLRALWATLTRLWPHLLSSYLQIVFVQKSLQFYRFPSVFFFKFFDFTQVANFCWKNTFYTDKTLFSKFFPKQKSQNSKSLPQKKSLRYASFL
jgi:hypothetical protein